MADEPCSVPGEVHFHLDLIHRNEDARVFRLLVPGEDFCPAFGAMGPIANAAGLLVLAFSELRGASPWLGMGLAKSGFERHCSARDPEAPDRCMGTLSAAAHCTSQPWCASAKWWLLRHLGADQLSRWRKLPGVWTKAAQPNGSQSSSEASRATREPMSPVSPTQPSQGPPPNISALSPWPAAPSPSPRPSDAPSSSKPPASAAVKEDARSSDAHARSEGEDEGRRLAAEQDAAEELERERCREKGRLALAEASPLVRAWIEDQEQAPAEAAASALDSLGEALQCNPIDAMLWPQFGVLMHMHRQLPLSSLLALRHAVELQPDSAHAYSELGVVAFDQLLFGDATTMSQMARVAQRSLSAVRQLHPRLEDHILRQSRGGRRLIALGGPSMHMHVLLAEARSRRKDMEGLAPLAPSISAAQGRRASSHEYEEYGSLAQIHRIRRDRPELLHYEKLQYQMEEASTRSAEALARVVPSAEPFDLEQIEEQLRTRVGMPCMRRPMPGDGIYDLCLLANATRVNYNFGELDENGRLPELSTQMLGRYNGSVRGNAENGWPLIVQFYEGGDPCGAPPRPCSTRVYFHCGRRLALVSAAQREPGAYRMNVSLPLLCSDESARSQRLDLPKKSKYYDHERYNRPKSAWDRLLDGTDEYLTGPVLGPAYYAVGPPIQQSY